MTLVVTKMEIPSVTLLPVDIAKNTRSYKLLLMITAKKKNQLG